MREHHDLASPRSVRTVACAAAGLLFALPLLPHPAAAQDLPCGLEAPREELEERLSPPDSSSVKLSAGTAKICYGAPSARGRQIMGGLVPFGQPWRLGANEPTTLHLSFPARVGGVELDPGSYALYAVPGEEEWEIVVNGDPDRWGVPINEAVKANDIGSTTVSAGETKEHVETLEIHLRKEGDGRAVMVISWERTRVAVPLEAGGG